MPSYVEIRHVFSAALQLYGSTKDKEALVIDWPPHQNSKMRPSRSMIQSTRRRLCHDFARSG